LSTRRLLQFALFAIRTALSLAAAVAPEAARWEKQARNVTIVRDDWGIAHVFGKLDADAVFGAIYAQAEDDFNRVETNYLTSLGRTAEAEGESKVIQDLRQKLFIDPVELKKLYGQSPPWLQTLMTAWADGLNFYLAKHPEVKPHVITHFEPWMALSFSEGSIGGDIEKVDLNQLEAFYGKRPISRLEETARPGQARRAPRLQRNRHRAFQHEEPSRPAVDQPAHVVFLSLGIADGQSARSQCIRRIHLGPVLCLSRLQ